MLVVVVVKLFVKVLIVVIKVRSDSCYSSSFLNYVKAVWLDESVE